jgi:TetR/AcrR family transcriptional regulator, cholesterol catabolism regulator
MGLNETGTSMKTVRALRKDKPEHVDAPAESRKKAVAEDEANAGRRLQIMTEAARLFATRGFDATKIRDIAAAAGILGGSIYYHFASKEEIFLAVHSAGMETISSAVKAAIAGVEDPWNRLEAAAVAHCEALLSTDELPVLVSPYFSESVGGLRKPLIAQRDAYDRLIAAIVDELDLPETIDRKIFRLHFLGALNWIPTWYRSGSRLTPAEIGRQLVTMLRRDQPG